MIVAFFHVRQDPAYADIAVQHVQKQMPGVRIVHMTDEETPLLAGCTSYRRPWDGNDLTAFRAELLSYLDDEVLSLGTDVIVQRDLSPVFAWPFDAALTMRTDPILTPAGTDVTRLMPYNTDVAFSRGTAFWKAAHEVCVSARGKFGWYADQQAAAIVAPRFNVLKLHVSNFNHTPSSADEDVSKRYAVHYKGQRKAWMLPLRLSPKAV